ncbi:MAG: WXG100 family type VII secretion target [Butyrivibrio sp.]|nr:WXG100 family type VII secretion target [Butyrivibrio sp.]
MKTVWQIQMDFDRAMDAARRLRSIASGMDSNAGQLGSTMNSIDRSWDGENSEAYLAKGKKVQNKLSVTANGIRQVAQAIEEIAIRTREAELAAIRIAED